MEVYGELYRQEARAGATREERLAKFNDLKKFSENFRLRTPVPADLLSILSNDEKKQQQIAEKALQYVDVGQNGDRPASVPQQPRPVVLLPPTAGPQTSKVWSQEETDRPNDETGFLEDQQSSPRRYDPTTFTETSFSIARESSHMFSHPSSKSTAITYPSRHGNTKNGARAPNEYPIIEEPGEDLQQVQTEEVIQPFSQAESVTSLTSVIVDDKIKKGIARTFADSVLRGLSQSPHRSHTASLSFVQELQDLIKRFSIQASENAPDRQKWKALHVIRTLRPFIATQIDAAIHGTTSERKIVPDIVERGPELLPPERTFTEKVLDWDIGDSYADFSIGASNVPDTRPEFSDRKIAEIVSIGDSVSYGLAVSDINDRALSDDADNLHALSILEDGDNQASYNYLINHEAFSEMMDSIRIILARYLSDWMAHVRQKVVRATRRHHDVSDHVGETTTAVFQFDWDVLRFLRSQYDGASGQDIREVITITGDSVRAQLTTVELYMLQTWPDTPFILLDPFQDALNDALGTSIHTFSTLDKNSQVIVELGQKRILATGTQRFLVTVAQQLTWLGAACRAAHPRDGLSYCDIDFRDLTDRSEDSAFHTFIISYSTKSLGAQEPKGCWTSMIANAVIVPGFPINTRPSQMKGLEVPIEIMAGIVGAPLAVDYFGGLVLKGEVMALVPVEKEVDFVQWHLVEGINSRIQYKDIAALCPKRLSLDDLDQEALLSTTAILGWCPQSSNHLATWRMKNSRIGYSVLKNTRWYVELTGGSLGFSKVASGTLSWALGKKDSAVAHGSSEWYGDDLDLAHQTHVIIMDTMTRRAWQTDAERLILQILLHRHQGMKSFVNDDGASVRLQAARADDPTSVRQAMLTNARIVLREDYFKDSAKSRNKLFKDVVRQLWAILCAMVEKSETFHVPGPALFLANGQHVEGYQYMDLVDGSPRLHAMANKLENSCGRWPRYARDIGALVIFGSSFGDIILPRVGSQCCPQYQTILTGSAYLVVEVRALLYFLQRNTNSRSQGQVTNSGIRWHQPAELFELCHGKSMPQGDPGVQGGQRGRCCSRLQVFVEKSSPLKDVRPPQKLEIDGAVIFGAAPKLTKSSRLESLGDNSLAPRSARPLASLSSMPPPSPLPRHGSRGTISTVTQESRTSSRHSRDVLYVPDSKPQTSASSTNSSLSSVSRASLGPTNSTSSPSNTDQRLGEIPMRYVAPLPKWFHRPGLLPEAASSLDEVDPGTRSRLAKAADEYFRVRRFKVNGRDVEAAN